MSLMQNQILPPAIRGMVTDVLVPGGPRGIEQFAAKEAPVELGDSG